MSEVTIHLHRADIERIHDLIGKFNNTDSFELKQRNDSGIGMHTTLTGMAIIDDVPGKFEVVVSSIESW